MLRSLIYLSVLIAFSSCNQSKKDDAVAAAENALSNAIAQFGISSPTARSSSTTASLSPSADVKSENVKNAATKEAEIGAILKKTSTATCVEGLELNLRTETQLKCYGPNVQVSNTYTLAGGDSFQQTNRTAPSGDTGIMYATEPPNESSGEACTAAKINVIVDDATSIIFDIQKMAAGFLCAANVAGKSKPEVGSSIELSSSEFPVSGITFTTAKLERMTADSGEKYKMTLVGTVTEKSRAFEITYLNTNTSSGDSGKIYGTISGEDTSQAAAFSGFSTIYSKTGNNVKVEFRRASNRGGANKDGLLDSNNIVDFGNSAAGESMFYTLLDVDSSTNVGKIKFAWMAGSGDSHSRVFHAETSSSGGTDSGTGHFGYGVKFNNLNGKNLGDMLGMICNWVLTKNGAGSTNHDTQIANFSGKAQKQAITRDSSGKYVVDSGSDNIDYSFHNTCDNAGAEYTISVITGAPGSETVDTSVTAVTVGAGMTNKLATYGSADAPTITAPTYTE